MNSMSSFRSNLILARAKRLFRVDKPSTEWVYPEQIFSPAEVRERASYMSRAERELVERGVIENSELGGI
jgi:hypothetical protein